MAVSIAIHALIFSAIGLVAPRTALRFATSAPPVELLLLPPIPHVRVHRAAATAAKAARTVVSGGAGAPALPHLHIPKPVVQPMAPAPIAAAPPPASGNTTGAPSTGASYAPAPLPAQDGGRGVRAMLRGTVGCDYGSVVHLTEEEKAHCLKAFGDAARAASPFSAIPGEKLGGYMREAAANARRRDAHDQNVPMSEPVVSCSGPGSNLGGGCLPEEAMTHVRRN